MKTKHISFQIIEDSRFTDKPKLQEQANKLRFVLAKFDVDLSITQPSFLDWTEFFQYRCNVVINYQPIRGKKLEIVKAINAVIPAPSYKFS